MRTKENKKNRGGSLWLTLAVLGLISAGGFSNVGAQSFDFEKLQKQIQPYTVILNIQVEFSFGTQTNEHEQRLLGTIVSQDGLLIFDGGLLQEENPLVPTFGFSFRSTLKRIDVVTLDEQEYTAEFLGVDRITRLGFARIQNTDQAFEPIRFVEVEEFTIGDWLAVYTLLPEYIAPPLAADIGMIGAAVSTPEAFPLTVGFNSMEMASVLFDKQLRPVGILGELTDPSRSSADQGGFMDSFDQGQMPLLGVITADRLALLIADPPQRGRVDRSWLGITMQALTPDLADFLHIGTPGGIIVNEVVPGSPAEAASLAVGDVIYAINEQRVTVDRDEELAIFQRMVSAIGPGTSIEIGIYRPGASGADSLRLAVVLAAAPMAASDAEDFEFEPFELRVRDLVFSDFLNYNLEQNALTGVVVAELRPGGLAAIGRLQPGDVIQRVNDQDIGSVTDFGEYLNGLVETKPGEVVFFVWRFGQTMFINVKTDW